MSPKQRRIERRLELRRILEMFDLNRTGIALTMLTVVALGGGVVVALLTIVRKL